MKICKHCGRPIGEPGKACRKCASLKEYWEPTPEEIRQSLAAIQDAWTPKEERAHRAIGNPPARIVRATTLAHRHSLTRAGSDE